MAEQRYADSGIHAHGRAGTLRKRRGILAAAGAVVAGLVARQMADPVAAVNPPFLLGQDNVPPTTNVATSITAYSGFGGGTTVLLNSNASPSGNDITGVGGAGSGLGSGVSGLGGSAGGSGVTGTGGANGGAGVSGTGGSKGGVGLKGIGGPAVGGSGVGAAVVALGPNATQLTLFAFPVGVYVKPSNSATVGIGVYIDQCDTGVSAAGNRFGVNASSYGDSGSVGVIGGAVNGLGVSGSSVHNSGVMGSTQGTGVVAGVYGTSTSAYGIIGNTTAAGYSGLTAITGTAGVAALAATATVNTAYAAYFQGTTVVQGDFAVVGGNKSAAVKDATGQHRLVYCVESPEAWLEDFGSGKLVGGKASVALDKTFAEIVHTDDYHIFLTMYGEQRNGLNVVERRADGFTVTERNNGTSGGAFSYRVVAKRKDIKAERLAKFALPKINIPDESKLPIPVPPIKT